MYLNFTDRNTTPHYKTFTQKYIALSYALYTFNQFDWKLKLCTVGFCNEARLRNRQQWNQLSMDRSEKIKANNDNLRDSVGNFTSFEFTPDLMKLGIFKLLENDFPSSTWID